MTAPDKIWIACPVHSAIDGSIMPGTYTAKGDWCFRHEYTRTDLAQATVAAAYEAAAQVAVDRKGFGSDAALVHPYDKGYVAACDAIATAIRALATPDQIAALAAERAKMHKAVEALRWYAEQVRLCRLIHGEGDAGRNALAADGGAKATAVLAEIGGA